MSEGPIRIGLVGSSPSTFLPAGAAIAMVWGLLILTMAGALQPPASSDDSELSRHLTTVRSQLANPALDLGRREVIAQDMAGTLDRAAQATSDPDMRRKRWDEAIQLLDGFTRENPEAGMARTLRFQAAVFRWAQAQTWMRALAFDPSNPKHRERASALLDDATQRLKSIAAQGDHTTLGENIRFRRAQVLADRAELEPEGSEGRKLLEAEALDLLEQPAKEVGLTGYWHLLRAELLLHAGHLDEARRALDAALQAKPAPPEDQLLAVRVLLLDASGRFDEALRAVEDSKLDPAGKGLLRVRIRLAQLDRTPEGPERARIRASLFQEVHGPREKRSPDAMLALLELARAGIEPAEDEKPAAWDAMADAYQAAGEPARAADADEHAADLAQAAGRPAEAAVYRLRAGAFAFQAGRFDRADADLSRVLDDPNAGDARPRAGMLRALARGRALAARAPGASAASYSEALERQIRDFPDDPVTHEARWLLGELLAESGSPSNLDRARSLWKAIAATSPRWLPSRLAIAALDRDALDRELINPDRRRLSDAFEVADQFLADSLDRSPSEADTAQLLLARTRLNLVPIAGRPEAARELCDRVARLPVSPSVQYRNRLLRMVALVELGRYIDAEREAQSHAEWDLPSETPAFFDAIRLLDQAAIVADTDLRQRRLGLVLELMIESVLKLDRQFPNTQLAELRMRLTRALLFVGRDREARRSMLDWRGTPAADDDRILRDLGDTYARLEAYPMAIDVQRLRIKNNPVGSMPWFDARYALALAYYHTDRHKDAAQLIDATAILHPDLGGGEFHDKFIRLRQRLGATH